MNIREMPVGDIKPYENNPRIIGEDAVEKVANSIREFGFQQPIVVDNENVIIVGHTRLLAAKKLGLKTVPVLMADNLTEEQVKAYRLADNKTGELAGWDFSLLDIELDEIHDMSMADFGFVTAEDVDIDSFFEESEDGEKAKEPKTIKCPHCGEIIEI